MSNTPYPPLGSLWTAMVFFVMRPLRWAVSGIGLLLRRQSVSLPPQLPPSDNSGSLSSASPRSPRGLACPTDDVDRVAIPNSRPDIPAIPAFGILVNGCTIRGDLTGFERKLCAIRGFLPLHKAAHIGGDHLARCEIRRGRTGGEASFLPGLTFAREVGILIPRTVPTCASGVVAGASASAAVARFSFLLARSVWTRSALGLLIACVTAVCQPFEFLLNSIKGFLNDLRGTIRSRVDF